MPGFSLAHKNVHFDHFWPLMIPKTVQSSGNGVPPNFQIFLCPEINAPPPTPHFQQYCQNVPKRLPVVGVTLVP